ncbi:MAG: Fur family transcriptional regulator [Candidatus Loosdrechtia sp.]|uniref:Fur family transcriptional regulator n=1 Tax=Candidatus Loosdrechtia sp. TaxID=3101272 RepID=UPI003A7910DA|nr:MAG: transcriptional repressor [Candidatus Jettenia sp. AMX2]
MVLESEEEIFKKYLALRKLKFTPERQAILNRVFANHKHFEVDELLVDLRNNDMRISKATIYRTLALLVKSGLLREVIFGERHAHYEHIYGHEHHDHLVCNSCGKIIEFSEPRIEKLQNEVCKNKKFKPESHRLQIQGLCEDCMNTEVSEKTKLFNH